MDRVAFKRACLALREEKGIGTLGEKALHAVLKRYYSTNGAEHELQVGRYVADAVNDDGLVEIQSRQWYRLLPKLKTFLPCSPVTAVYPLVRRKTVIWVDPESGAVAERRKSPKIGTVWEIFPELYAIREVLTDPGLTVRVAVVDADEYRMLDGRGKDRKHHATKWERMPTELVDEHIFRCADDYADLLPRDLPETWTADTLAKELKIRLPVAQKTVRVLRELGVIALVGKEGRKNLYCANFLK